ncbi:hypothetical protein [Salmonella enterica]|uniref:hypothetical protein n=1 Tax=Salmonella enterica TaxID=28901 RepID=UPI0012B6A2E0|nr:hypothetical protein [Salmonella enterica]EBS7186490.1 hypothetical protein [Salmonella enterica]ECK6865706.1 hypothetical protein [Salmonella enterica]EFS2571979.1 hypothetical protein [Salmonella enterica]EGL5809887.1 hypothetical protein [Salmonella enterica]EMD8593618.1 hypothetical protein [Salmonella enterica]
MGRNSSGLHLKIAEWILERGEAACVYDVAMQFGVTVRQAIGLLSSVVTDSAIETRTGLIIPDRPSGRYNTKCVRSVSVLSIDHETISRRKKAHQCHSYHAKSHQPETCCEMSRAEKWEWVIRNARRRKR